MKIGTLIWHSKRVSGDNEEITLYDKPVSYRLKFNYLTCQKAISRGAMEIMKYGEDVFNTWTMIAKEQVFKDIFNVGDVVWVENEQPIESVENTYGNGSSATAIIDNIILMEKYITIVLKRNKNQILK